MSSEGSGMLVFAALCFAGAAVTFLVFFGPGLLWRLRSWSWRGRAVLAGSVAGVGAILSYVAHQLLR